MLGSMSEEPAADELLARLVRSVSAIPDPIARARECVRVGDELRGVQGQLADVRRRAIYEATLQPGATGRSVSEELGVSAKTVSLASAEYRREDLALLRRLLDEAKKVSPRSQDVAHAEAMLASTANVGVIAHVIAALSHEWMRTVDADDDDEAWDDIHKGFEHAEYLADLYRPAASKERNVDALDPNVPAELRWLTKVLNAMPGISGWGSVEDRGAGVQEWSMWWTIESADRNLDPEHVGPSREGWLVSEWLVWLVRDYRLAGKQLESRVTAPPPMLNYPGGMMTFHIDGYLEGPDAIDPNEFARSIIRLWDGSAGIRGTGYYDIEWPKATA